MRRLLNQTLISVVVATCAACGGSSSSDSAEKGANKDPNGEKGDDEPGDDTDISEPIPVFIYDSKFLTQVDGLFSDAVVDKSLQADSTGEEVVDTDPLSVGRLAIEVYRPNLRLAAIREELSSVAAMLSELFGDGKPFAKSRTFVFKLTDQGRKLFKIPVGAYVSKSATEAYALLEYRKSETGAPRILTIFEKVDGALRWALEVQVTTEVQLTKAVNGSDDLRVRLAKREKPPAMPLQGGPGKPPPPKPPGEGGATTPPPGLVEIQLKPSSQSLIYIRTLSSFDNPPQKLVPAHETVRIAFDDESFHVQSSVRDLGVDPTPPQFPTVDFRSNKRKSGDAFISELVSSRDAPLISSQRTSFVERAEAAKFSVPNNPSVFDTHSLDRFGAEVFLQVFGSSQWNSGCSTLGSELKQAFTQFVSPSQHIAAYEKAKIVLAGAPDNLCNTEQLMNVVDAACRFVEFSFIAPSLKEDLCQRSYRNLIVELKGGIGTVVGTDGVRTLVHSTDGLYYDDEPGTEAHAFLRKKFLAPEALSFPELSTFAPHFTIPEAAIDVSAASTIE